MATQTLPSIKKVEFIPTAEMELYPRKILKPGDTTAAIGNFTRLNMTEQAEAETTSAPTPNGLVYTTKVKGSIYDEQNQGVQHKLQILFHNYILTDIYNQKFLVGLKDKPFPEILFNPVNPASPSSRRVVNFEITWISTLPPIKVVDLA